MSPLIEHLVIKIDGERAMKRPRDMSRTQFRAALKRHGWRQVLAWIEIGGGRSIGMVMIGGKFNLRASLAHAIRESTVTAP